MIKLTCEWPECFHYDGYETYSVNGDIKFDNDKNSPNYKHIIFHSMGRGYAIPYDRVIKIERIEE